MYTLHQLCHALRRHGDLERTSNHLLSVDFDTSLQDLPDVRPVAAAAAATSPPAQVFNPSPLDVYFFVTCRIHIPRAAPV
jgi:hypothetical protein